MTHDTSTSTTEPRRVPTARAIRGLGLPGEATATLLRFTAPARAEARARETSAAARTWAAMIAGQDPARPRATGVTVEAEERAVAAALLLLDLVGVGGRAGVEGVGTARLPCFRRLGRGRKQAGDGEAYMAAAQAALSELLHPGEHLGVPAVDGPALAAGLRVVAAYYPDARPWVLALGVRAVAARLYPEELHREPLRHPLEIVLCPEDLLEILAAAPSAPETDPAPDAPDSASVIISRALGACGDRVSAALRAAEIDPDAPLPDRSVVETAIAAHPFAAEDARWLVDEAGLTIRQALDRIYVS